MSPNKSKPCMMCDAFCAVKDGTWTKKTLFAFGFMAGREFTESRVMRNLCAEHQRDFQRAMSTATAHFKKLEGETG